MGHIGAQYGLHAAAGAIALLLGLGAPMGPGPGAAERNCHDGRDGACVKIGPYPLPLSVPEFNRLSMQLQDKPETAASLVLFALLNAAEAPQLAAELGSLRLAPQSGDAQETFRRFVTTDTARATRCAASFVVGAQAPSYRYSSIAIAFWARTEATAGQGKRTATLCSVELGCIPFDLTRDPDKGWLVISLKTFMNACKKLK